LNSISIVIPAYNEAARLPATLQAILEYTGARERVPFEILIVNDGSKDNTLEVAREFASAHPHIRVVENPGNRGKGYSVRHGMLEATGDWVLFTDSDLSAPIEELDLLLAAVRSQAAKVAIGSRADRSKIEIKQSPLRQLAGRVFNLLMRVTVGLPFKDTQCGFKLFDAESAREVFRRQRIERWGFDAEILFIARKLGYKTVEVPVRWQHAEGSKVSMFSDSLNMFADLLRIRRNQLMGYYK